MGIFGLFSKDKKEKLNKGIFVTKQSFFSRLSNALLGRNTIDESVLSDVEEVLISSDVGVETSMKIIDRLRENVKTKKDFSVDKLNEEIKVVVSELISMPENNTNEFKLPGSDRPYVVMVVGVNGVGKTTTIGKLAHQYKQAGYSVVLGAADTFRAAAVDQLKIWGARVDVPVVAQDMGADPASVAFDTLSSAVSKKADLAIIDTAGRLHNKTNLMNELSKIKRVMQKVVPGAPHEVLLVLDASTGQNAINQCREFSNTTDVTALALTKLDGTAKGGVVIGISDQFKIPVKYIGVGEKVEDLQVFNSHEFVDSMFSK